MPSGLSAAKRLRESRVPVVARLSLALGVFASPRVANPRKGRLCGCLVKWWRVPRGVPIPAERQRGIVDFLMAWIGREMKKSAQK